MKKSFMVVCAGAMLALLAGCSSNYVMTTKSDAVLAAGNKERLERLYNELINKDWFMTLLDLEDYIKVKEQMLADYEDRDAWLDKVIVNISKAGFFSSDRTIAQYNEDIWHLN